MAVLWFVLCLWMFAPLIQAFRPKHYTENPNDIGGGYKVGRPGHNHGHHHSHGNGGLQ